MRVGCGSATIGIFARQFHGLADEVVVVDDHITGVLTEHQAGRCLDMRASGIRMRGRKSTPGRYFQVANPGTGWGGTDIADPLTILEGWDEAVAWPGLRLLMTSTTGEHASWYVLDEALVPREQAMPPALRAIVERIGENCEPSLCTVLFLGGAGGSLRAGVTQNPVLLTRSIKQALVNVTCGGAPAYVWPGGGITIMTDVMRMPDHSFGTVPTPALVAPIEFSMRLDDFRALGGHVDHVRPLRGSAAARRLAQRRRTHRAALAAGVRRQSLAAGPPAGDRLKRPSCTHDARCCPTAAGTSSMARSTSSSAPTAIPTRCRPRTPPPGNGSTACSKNWSRNWRCCASRWAPGPVRCAAPWRGACGRPVDRTGRASSPRWPPWRVPSRRN